MNSVATALSFAFLSTVRWDRVSLVDAGAQVLGARRRWLSPLAREVLAAYPRRPADAPRELTAMIQGSDALSQAITAARARGASIRIHTYVVTPAEARPAPPVPRLDTITDLAALLHVPVAQLEWLADTKGMNRRAAAGPLHHYRYEWVARPGRVPRLLEVPSDRLKRVQRVLLASVVGLLPVHEAAHGFVPGRSAVTGAARHADNEVVIALDLVTFFARVRAARVYGILREAGLPEAVVYAITGLCTNRVPPRVLSAMPPGGSVEERFALRQALTAGHLPQGAPTSPALANLALRRLDARLAGWAQDATYTRYADDLAFSGDLRGADAFIRGVQRIVEDEGHSLNVRKSRVRPAATRQTVTGIVVNEHPNVPRREFDALKAIIHNCVLQGPASQNRAGHGDFRAHLQGRISWVASLNPERGAKLTREFRQIQW